MTAAHNRRLDDTVIVAAIKRGWSAKMIAIAGGVSHQAVFQRVEKIESVEGIAYKRHNMRANDRRKKFIESGYICEYCAMPFRVRGIHKRYRDTRSFCSQICFNLSVKRIFAAEVESAIAMRLDGVTWTGIAKILGITAQGIQRAIFYYLRNKGELTAERLHPIWFSNDGRCGPPPSWKWLINWRGRSGEGPAKGLRL